MRLFLVLPELSELRGYVVAVVAVLLTGAVQVIFLGEPSIAPFVLFFLTVATVSSLAGRGPGLVSVVLSAAFANYLFTGPFGTWTLTRPVVEATALFLGSGGAIAFLCSALRGCSRSCGTSSRTPSSSRHRAAASQSGPGPRGAPSL